LMMLRFSGGEKATAGEFYARSEEHGFDDD
jgi:hypothetical protein